MKNILMSFLCLTLSILFPALGLGKDTPDSGERVQVDLTIYNQNLSLIREERMLDFVKGLGHIVIPDIPSTIDGTSLHFRSLTDPEGVKVLEQNYQYDLVHQAKLLEKYIGKQVEFVRYDSGTKKEYSVFGKLLAQRPGSPASVGLFRRLSTPA